MHILPVQMALPSRKQGEAATGILNSLVTPQEIQEDGQLRGQHSLQIVEMVQHSPALVTCIIFNVDKQTKPV